MSPRPVPVWVVAGVRTPFTRVDGALKDRDAIGLGVPVLQAMGERATKIDVGFWGSVIPSLKWSNLARETWLDAGLDPTVPTSTVVRACSTSMMAAFDAAGLVGRGVADLALAGGSESMTHIQLGLTQGLTAELGQVPRDRLNPTGGSVALGHPFAATGARILSQAIKELAAMPTGTRAIVSICADGGVGTVCLLEA